MNYGGEAADQVVRYSIDGMERGIKLSGALAKNLAVFFAAVIKDTKRSRGKTHLMRMLKENRPLKFFSMPTNRLSEFSKEGKKRGLLYVVIRDRKNPAQCEVMVYAEDAAKVNRVMDKLELDFLKSENGAVHEMEISQPVQDTKADSIPAAQTEVVQMPEGELQFEISDLEEDFNIGTPDQGAENFTQAQESRSGNPSDPFLRTKSISDGLENKEQRPSVQRELDQIKHEINQRVAQKREKSSKKDRSKNRSKAPAKSRKKQKSRER